MDVSKRSHSGFRTCLNDAFSNNILTALSFGIKMKFSKFSPDMYTESARFQEVPHSKSNWLFGSGFPVLIFFGDFLLSEILSKVFPECTERSKNLISGALLKWS